MKGLLKASDMKKIIDGMDQDDIPEMVNAMLEKAFSESYKQYESLREMVNKGTVSKEMMIHENDGISFGETIQDIKKKQTMYQSAKQVQQIRIAKQVSEMAHNELDEDLKLERKLDEALNKI